MNILDVIEKAVRLHEEKGKAIWAAEDADGKFHVSDLNGCRRKTQLTRRKAPATNVEPIEAVITKEMGTQWQKFMQELLEPTGVTLRADWKHNPWTQTMADVRGHPDYSCIIDGKLLLLDWKSKKDGWFRKYRGIKEISAPEKDDCIQLNTYMWLTGFREGGIVYINRNNGQLLWAPWTFDEELHREVLSRLETLRNDDKETELPPRLAADAFPCYYRTQDGVTVHCKFFSGCHPEVAVASRLETLQSNIAQGKLILQPDKEGPQVAF